MGRVCAGAVPPVCHWFGTAPRIRLTGTSGGLGFLRNARVRSRLEYQVPRDAEIDSPKLIRLAAGERDHCERCVPTFPRRAAFDVVQASPIVALGNAGDPAATETLGVALGLDDARLRSYSAWALGQLATNGSRALLESALLVERDPEATAEIEVALAGD